jgi:myo-inositol 2-dehydrogenase / D-chiro-inositol 1-dehydrogenase
MPDSSPPNRREFLKSSTVAAAGASLVGSVAFAGSVHTSVDDTLRVGLIGCGGRGTDATSQALNADKNVKLVAMGDAFADRLATSLRILRKGSDGKIDVTPERCFHGFDAYKGVLGAGVDVVILTTPPHFRPMHLKAAVEAGKHVFCEKPVAVDAQGVRSVLETAKEAKKKGLNIVSGLCWRYDPPKRETVKRIHEGAIGDVTAIHSTYLTGTLWHHGRKPEWSDMEYQVRNWLYFNWLSGDHINEQHIHSLDKTVWVMNNEPPMSAVGIGGRQVRTSEEYGNIYDHFAIVYEFANGVKVFSSCRQMANCQDDVSDHIIGTHGSAQLCSQLMPDSISGPNKWSYSGPRPNMYQVEHNELFAAIRGGTRIDNSLYMARSTLMAIMGRTAAYTGQKIQWDQMMASNEDLTPKYEWGPLLVAAVAMPGMTKFV